MGKQTNLHYRGTRGQLVYYELNGGYYVRTKPTQVIQTASTKVSAGKFDLAVRTGKALRSIVAPLLPDTKDRQLMFRLNTAVYQWLLASSLNNMISSQPVGPLTNFSLTEKTSLAERLKLSLQTEWQQQGKTVLTIPAMIPTTAIAAPAHTLSVDLQLIIGSCRLADQCIIDTQAASVSLAYTAAPVPAQQLSIPFAQAPGCLCVVAAALKYHLQGKYGIAIENRLEWLPAGIVSAVVMG